MGVLYFREMRHDHSNPHWENRDYFINSKAHSAPGYYATLAVAGYFPKDEMKDLRKFGSRLQGHPVRYAKLKTSFRTWSRIFRGIRRYRSVCFNWNSIGK